VEVFSSNIGEKGKDIIHSIVHDVTDRKQAESALKKSEERYRTLIESTRDLIYTTDRKGFLSYLNPTLEKTLGYAHHDEWNGKPFVQIVAPECIASMRDNFRRAMKGEPIPAYEVDLIRKDGTRLPVEFNVTTLYDSEGNPSGRYGIGRDITDRNAVKRELNLYRLHLEDLIRERTKGLEQEIAEHHRTEQALLKTKEAAETANRAKSAFLSNMSHEFRTPLSAIIGFTDVLNKQYYGPLNDRQMEYIQDIVASGKHLLALISDILDLAKIEAGKDDLNYVPVSMPELLVNSIFMIREKTRIQGIEVRVETEKSLDNIKVMADVRRLQQVMYNLLSNAAKFTPAGGRIIIRVRVVTDTAPGQKDCSEFIEVSVTDTGIGLAREDLGKIFEEFHQINAPTTGKNPGTGLGLALAQRIVGMHGGRIWAESAGLGQGSTFIFRIPCAPPQGSF
jgi:PAS domain S-box-containing protein